MRFILLLAFLSMAYPACHAEVVKWIDASGRVHYGERPPTGEAVTKAPMTGGTVSIGDGLSPVPAYQAPSDQPGTPNAAPRRGEVWIYVTPQCGFCRRAEEHMRQRGIPFTVKDITANVAYRAEFQALGGRGVPVTLSGNNRVNGYSKDKFEAFLKVAGF